MSLAANALTTVAAVSGLAPGVTQARLEQLINAVSQQVERELWPLGYKVVTGERLAGSGTQQLFTKRAPIRSVQQVLVSDQAVTDYFTDAEFLARGELYRELGWPRQVSAYGDLTRDLDSSAPWYSVQVDYTAGWILPQYGSVTNPDTNPDGAASDFPPDLEEAVIQTVVELAQRTTGSLIREKTPGGWEMQWSGGGSAPIAFTGRALQIINSYRRRWTV